MKDGSVAAISRPKNDIYETCIGLPADSVLLDSFAYVVLISSPPFEQHLSVGLAEAAAITWRHFDEGL